MSDTSLERLFDLPLTRPRLSLGARMLRFLGVAMARSRERRSLAELDTRLLRDIGITPYEAGVEASKPWWRP